MDYLKINPQSALGKALAFNKKINELKQFAEKTGLDQIVIDCPNGDKKTLYYYSLRWHEKPSTIGKYKTTSMF